jgi:membrane protease YdiL (CAAX protease family)
MDTRLNTKRILIFLAFACGIAWAGVLAFYLIVGTDDPDEVGRLAKYLNWFFALPAPTLANVATRLITREGWGHLMLRPNFRRGWRFYLAAWLLPLLAVIVGGAIYYLVFPRSFDPNLGVAREAVASTPSLAAANPWTIVLISTLSALIVGPVFLLLQSIGEEFGWRGYLLPKFVERFTGAEAASGSTKGAVPAGLSAAAARKAALLVGVVWGVWHWPGIFLEMKTSPGIPIIFLLVDLVSMCSVSVLLAWVTLRSRSVWPAVIGHAVLNATVGLSLNMLNGLPDRLLGPLPSGLIGGTGYLALALVLFFSRRAFAAGKEARPARVPAVVITHPG